MGRRSRSDTRCRTGAADASASVRTVSTSRAFPVRVVGKEREQLEAGGIEPLEVVDGEQRGSRGCDALRRPEQRLEEPEALESSIAGWGRQRGSTIGMPRGELGHETRELGTGRPEQVGGLGGRLADQAAEHLGERKVGDVRVQREAVATDDTDRAVRAGDRLVEEAGLPDAGLAADDDDSREPAPHLGDGAAKDRQLRVAADDDRAGGPPWSAASARQRVCAAFSARARRANKAMDTPLPDVLFPTETHRQASPDRRTGNVEEHSMVGATDVIRACIVGAMRAPSAHNAQPWRLSRVDGRSYLLWYAFADKLRADPDDRDGLIAVRGSFETLRLEAQLRGLDASLSPATERHAHGITLGTVTFTDLAGEADPLAHAIGTRRCDRHPYSRTPLPSDLTDGLTALGNVMLPPSEVAPLVSRAAAASWQDDRFVADMTTWTRWVPVAPDGMTFDCLRLDRFEQMALWLALRLGRLPGRLAAVPRDMR